MPACNGEKNDYSRTATLAERDGTARRRANEGVDHAARTAHEEVLYRLRLAQARLKGVQARSAKAAIKKSYCRTFPAGLRNAGG